MNSKNEDRRRFFRITDAIGVSYSIISDEDAQVEQGKDSDGKNIDVKKLLEAHNQSIQTALEQLKNESPLVATVLSEMDKKLETVIALLEIDGKPAYSIEQASISACGIAFPVNKELVIDTALKMNLYLETSGQEIEVQGRVVGCAALPEENTYYLRAEFTEMQDQDREKLIQHIVQRQGLLLRSLREQMED